ELTTEDLDSLRQALTVYYIKHGYINSGAVIPDQEVKDGIIRVQIVEGRLTAIEVQGNRWFADGFLKRRLALGVEQPLNIEALQRRLQLLQQQPLIERLHGALKPGPAPGESVLLVQVEEQQPFEITLGFDNYQSPTVGAEEGWVTIADRNLFGYGDALSLGYGASEGAEPQWDFSYTLPFTAYDTTLILRCRKNKFKVVESPFDSLNVETKSEIYSLGIRQPVYRSLNHEVALSLVGEHSRDRTYLLGERFSFYPGEENGKAIVTALRFAQEWVYHTQKQVIAARSQFSFGLDTLHATTNSGDTPDGRFLAWLGQFQWARVVSPWDIQLLWRTDLQLANDSLLPLEQIAIGGRYSVRGYRENQLVRDQGLIASLEARIPLVQHAVWAEYLQLVPFVDYGRGWNRDLDTPPVKHISSVGLGLRWAASWRRAPLTLRPQLEVYWGIPLRDVDNPDNDLQDDGLHLQFTLSCF
ncbi:MAG: ShlB/FhaC/HecB family hemolysin secretion/activation protein, partial [Deltaproteobacteria bacterium]|nr:ShlB/FhaC/HecB family hemolysin secretion/activation protein [Deltaproteobacteria bacterium]